MAAEVVRTNSHPRSAGGRSGPSQGTVGVALDGHSTPSPQLHTAAPISGLAAVAAKLALLTGVGAAAGRQSRRNLASPPNGAAPAEPPTLELPLSRTPSAQAIPRSGNPHGAASAAAHLPAHWVAAAGLKPAATRPTSGVERSSARAGGSGWRLASIGSPDSSSAGHQRFSSNGVAGSGGSELRDAAACSGPWWSSLARSVRVECRVRRRACACTGIYTNNI